jgi:LacI family transcriptional regulator
MSNNITITHIAQAAGVSTATVDRVLNNRPGVNPATVQKVRDAVAALGAGNPTRGRPRLTPNYKFAFVLPANRRGFFDMVDRVIAQAAGDFRHQHITQVTHRLSTGHARDFAMELADLGDFDGIALLAPDIPPVKLAVNALVRSGVHVVTLFSDVPGSMRETFIGADNRAAGRTAGLLLGRSLPRHEPGLCALLSPATRYAAEIDRRIGFVQVIEERFPNTKLVRVNDVPESEDDAWRTARTELTDNAVGGRLHALYNVGPGSWGVSRALAELGYDASLCFAAHDLVETHRTMLVSNALSYVLHQDVFYAVMAAARVLRSLCEGMRGALAVSNPRIEILTAENID